MTHILLTIGLLLIGQEPLQARLPDASDISADGPGSGSIATGLQVGMLDPKRPINKQQRSPIWRPFLTKFNECAPGCKPMGEQTFGKAMCHVRGNAIDVFGMKCIENGREVVYKAINDRGAKAKSGTRARRITDVVECMAGKRNAKGYNINSSKLAQGGLGCIWHKCSMGRKDVTGCHRDHLHCSLGCGGGRF